MISWKHSFRKLNEEYELAKKKKRALDNLRGSGKISEATHSLFDREIDDAIAEIENQRKALLEKMASKTTELEEQLRTLEILLANFEIQHVTGEIDEEIYQHETDLLSMGLETTRHELDAVQEAATQLSSEDLTLSQQVESQMEVEPCTKENEPSHTEVKLLEEPVPVLEKGTKEPSQETIVETIQCKEGTQHSETEAESKEGQES